MKKTFYILLFVICLLGTFVLKAQPVANFTAGKVAGCSPLTVQFTSLSTGSPASYYWTFGNGNTSTLQDPSATYVNPGTYNVSLTVTNGSGSNTKTVAGYITVYPNPVANFTASPIVGCTPLSVSFSDNSTPGTAAITQWQWDFGNGGISTQQNPSKTFNTIDSFTVSLIVTDANGCQNTVTRTKYIKTSSPFLVDFTATGNTSCSVPAVVNFGSTISPAGAYSYLWTFGDGSTSTLPNPPHTYTNGGSYTVELEITGANGCKQKVIKPNFVKVGGLNAAFTYSLSTACAPAIINLTNTSSPNLPALVFGWSLDGTQDKYSTNTNYILTTQGPHQVKLIAKDPAGCFDTAIQIITLSPRPESVFKANKYVFCDVPATVQFTDLSRGGVISWAWNFGNNVSNTTQNPSISYVTEGTFSVRLIASKGGSCSDTSFATITVGKPNVDIRKQHQKSGCVPYTATFDLTDNSLIPLTGWKWELKNTLLSSNSTFSYTFNDTGTFVIKLTGTNAEGCIFTGYDTVKVGVKPVFDFTADKFSGCYNKTKVQFAFLNLSPVKPTSLEWDFGTKQQSNEVNPLIIFNDTGLYYVKLKVSHNGCATELIKPDYIKIYPPIAKFIYHIDECATDTVKFKNTSAGQNKLLWKFGDNTFSTDSMPVHSYPNPGTMLVWLITEDTVSRCKDSIPQTINIVKPPLVKFTPTDTGVCPGSIVKFTDQTITDPSRSIRTWEYTVSNGKISTVQHPSFQFTGKGWYGVSLKITDDKNCEYTYSDSTVVKVFQGKTKIKSDRIAGCSPMTVNVSDSSVSDNAVVLRKWFWGTGDSTVTTLAGASYVYRANPADQSKGYMMKVVVTDDKGCTFPDSILIRATKPIADYSMVTGKSCGKDTIKLNAITNAQTLFSPGGFSWRLPTGTSNISNPKVVLSGVTTYSIKLQVTDANGCIDSITKNVAVDTRPPQIGFDATPRNIPCYKSNTTVKFRDTTVRGGNPIASWKWTFGDNTGAEKNDTPSKVYFKPGRYPVSLTIKDSAGCTQSLSIPDFLVVGGPFGSYTFSPRKGCNPVRVSFSVLSPNAKYSIWDHADGKVDTITTDTHSYVYNRVGVYYPRITLQDSTETCDLGYDAIDSIVVFPLPKVDFDADMKLICKNSSVLFSNLTNPRPYPINQWKWTFGTGDSSLLEGPVSHAYPNEGRYKVTLEATDINGCYSRIEKDSFIQVNDDTIPPQTPIVKRATVESNESVLFEYLPNNDADFAKYIIYTDNTQVTENNINVTAYTETGLNTLEWPYAYKMVAVDVCRNQSKLSKLHRTVELKAAGATNAIALNWTPYQGFDTAKVYEIWKKAPGDAAFSQLTTVHGDTTHYTDSMVFCHQLYFYRIKTVETGNLMQISWSDTSGAIPVYVPVLPVPENIRATVENNSYVRMEWHQAKHNRAFTYDVYRSVDDKAPVFYKSFSAADTVLIDKDVDVQEHAYTYTTYVVDACGGQSQPSNIARTILLNVHMVGNDALSHDPELNWNAYSSWGNGVDHYNVSFYYDSIQVFSLISRNVESELTAKHRYVNLVQNDYCYLVTGFKRGDTTVFSESNITCVTTAPRLYAPNVFTINGDGLNDVFYVRGVFIDKFNLKIFNRWGQQIFETENLNQGWDGTFNGEACQSDAFVYLAEGIGRKGQKISISGNVTILR